MQDNVIQAQSQPFMKLVQDNMDLLTRFSTSPEVTSEATANAGKVFQQATEFAMKLMQSGAFMQVIQGMTKNYTEFLASFSQTSMTMLNSGQAALTRQVKDATDGITEAAEQQGRRIRQAA